jgi:hypothetical protein
VISVLRPEAKLFGLRCLMIIGTEGAVGDRTPENLKIDLLSPSRSSLDSLLRRPVQPRFLVTPA